ncbi:MAG: PEGA domain-containing protein [Planctomycetota bacterium]|nr:PEGA domain-containing protein [Planctomycetota bacterium]
MLRLSALAYLLLIAAPMLVAAEAPKPDENANLPEYKPQSTDGKAFIQSEPAEALIIFLDADGSKTAGKKTPALVQLPKGRQTVQLTLKGFKPATLCIDITDQIAKPEKVVLELPTVSVDVLFEDGWTIFVDGKVAKVGDAKPAVTPGTVMLPLGRHDVGLAKNGFVDIRQRVEVTDAGVRIGQEPPSTTLQIKSAATKGVSQLLLKAAAEQKAAEDAIKDRVSGRYVGINVAWGVGNHDVILRRDGTLVKDHRIGGKWESDGNTLKMIWTDYPVEVLKTDGKDGFKSSATTITKIAPVRE